METGSDTHPPQSYGVESEQFLTTKDTKHTKQNLELSVSLK